MAQPIMQYADDLIHVTTYKAERKTIKYSNYTYN